MARSARRIQTQHRLMQPTMQKAPRSMPSRPSEPLQHVVPDPIHRPAQHIQQHPLRADIPPAHIYALGEVAGGGRPNAPPPPLNVRFPRIRLQISPYLPSLYTAQPPHTCKVISYVMPFLLFWTPPRLQGAPLACPTSHPTPSASDHTVGMPKRAGLWQTTQPFYASSDNNAISHPLRPSRHPPPWQARSPCKQPPSTTFPASIGSSVGQLQAYQ